MPVKVEFEQVDNHCSAWSLASRDAQLAQAVKGARVVEGHGSREEINKAAATAD